MPSVPKQTKRVGGCTECITFNIAIFCLCGGAIMPNVTIICYLSSLLAYGMGFSKMLVLKNAVTEHVNTFDYNINVSLATGYFVLAIFFAVIGFLFYTLRIIESKKLLKLNDIEFRGKASRESEDGGVEIPAHSVQYKHLQLPFS